MPRYSPRVTRRTELALIAAVSVAGFLVVWLLSDGFFLNPVMAALAMAGAGGAAALLPRHPGAAVGVVFLLSTLSLLSIGLPIGRMRLEQPAIAALFIGLYWHRHELQLQSLRSVAAVMAAGAVYLAVSLVSSAMNAPDVGESMRFVLWTAVSMLGGLAAYLLSAGARPQHQAIGWFAASGLVMAVLGLAVATAFYLNGPGVPGIMGGDFSANPKVMALSFEANLYASLLSATAFFAIERLRQQRTLAWAVVAGLTLVGIGVGITRGAYIGLAAGLLLYAAVLWRRHVTRPVLVRVLALFVATTLAGMVVGAVLMDARVRDAHLVARAEPPPSLGEPDDLATLDWRLDKLGPAWEDVLSSPFIGTGLGSFDGLHPLPNGELNYINIMAVMTLHDSGLIGLVALATFFGLILIRLWRASGDPARAGPAAAYIGALVTLLIAYQATVAIHFALNWLIAGAALGLTVVRRDAANALESTEPTDPAMTTATAGT